MRSYLYVDEYGLVDTSCLVHAIPVDHSPDESDDAQEWHIVMILSVGDTAVPALMKYPTRGLRDQAFEALCAIAIAVAEATHHAIHTEEPEHA
jgi:hypothetical protein